jgi:hypothetical protein
VIEISANNSHNADLPSVQQVVCPTPRYVLLQDEQPVGPEMAHGSSGRSFLAIYGFSGKAAYDAFISNSEGDLRPYPLTKRYLQNQLTENTDKTCIVIIDADHPVAASLAATPFENVLAAYDNADTQLVSELPLAATAVGYLPTAVTT